MDVVRFGILGIATGATTALVALGIVVVYRASGVINFASGAMGGIAAFVFYSLRDDDHLNTALAMVLSLGLGAVLGMLTQVLVVSGMRNSSPLVKLIGTLGLMTAAEGFTIVEWGGLPSSVNSILPNTRFTWVVAW